MHSVPSTAYAHGVYYTLLAARRLSLTHPLLRPLFPAKSASQCDRRRHPRPHAHAHVTPSPVLRACNTIQSLHVHAQCRQGPSRHRGAPSSDPQTRQHRTNHLGHTWRKMAAQKSNHLPLPARARARAQALLGHADSDRQLRTQHTRIESASQAGRPNTRPAPAPYTHTHTHNTGKYTRGLTPLSLLCCTPVAALLHPCRSLLYPTPTPHPPKRRPSQTP